MIVSWFRWGSPVYSPTCCLLFPVDGLLEMGRIFFVITPSITTFNAGNTKAC